MKTSFWQQTIEWVGGINIAIKEKEYLTWLTLTRLKAIARRMNKEMGLVITKARFDASWSRMKKDQLVDAIWAVRRVLMVPKGKGKFMFNQITRRIFEYNCEGQTHVHYLGFETEQEAFKFHSYIESKKLCTLASMRDSKRLEDYGWAWEIKVWGIDAALLGKLFAKELAATEVVVTAEGVYEVEDKYNLAQYFGISLEPIEGF
jgi:hypothetical protein